LAEDDEEEDDDDDDDDEARSGCFGRIERNEANTCDNCLIDIMQIIQRRA
jgi:hypothetical protein